MQIAAFAADLFPLSAEVHARILTRAVDLEFSII
jgi:hypothetical protein